MTEEQKRALDALDMLDDLLSVEDDNTIGGTWQRSHYEVNGETLYRAEIVKSDLIALRKKCRELRQALTTQTVTDDDVRYDGHMPTKIWVSKDGTSKSGYIAVSDEAATRMVKELRVPYVLKRAATAPKPCECDALVKALEEMIEAAKTGNIDSPTLQHPETGEDCHKWHEEWSFNAEQSLATHRKNKETGDV